MKTGLVLEGGALRGMFSCGVLDFFLEQGISFDGMIGVSAGAVFGCNFKSRQIGRAIRYNKRLCRDIRYGTFWSWLRTGDFFDADFCYREIPDELDPFDRKAFAENPMAFYLVCTDVISGKAVYRRCDAGSSEDFQWMRASGSMPFFSRPVTIGGARYLDGAVTDSIPLRFFEENGYEKIVVILTQPAGFRKKAPAPERVLKLLLHRYPALAEALAHRHEIYNAQLQYVEEQAKAGRILLIRPEAPLPIHRLCREPDLLQQTYDLGRVQAEKHGSAIRNFLSGK